MSTLMASRYSTDRSTTSNSAAAGGSQTLHHYDDRYNRQTSSSSYDRRHHHQEINNKTHQRVKEQSRDVSSRSSDGNHNDSNEAEVNKPSPVCEFGDWAEYRSSSGKIYYYNSRTEVSQWEKPEEWRQADRVAKREHRDHGRERESHSKRRRHSPDKDHHNNDNHYNHRPDRNNNNISYINNNTNQYHRSFNNNGHRRGDFDFQPRGLAFRANFRFGNRGRGYQQRFPYRHHHYTLYNDQRRSPIRFHDEDEENRFVDGSAERLTSGQNRQGEGPIPRDEDSFTSAWSTAMKNQDAESSPSDVKDHQRFAHWSRQSGRSIQRSADRRPTKYAECSLTPEAKWSTKKRGRDREESWERSRSDERWLASAELVLDKLDDDDGKRSPVRDVPESKTVKSEEGELSDGSSTSDSGPSSPTCTTRQRRKSRRVIRSRDLKKDRPEKDVAKKSLTSKKRERSRTRSARSYPRSKWSSSRSSTSSPSSVESTKSDESEKSLGKSRKSSSASPLVFVESRSYSTASSGSESPPGVVQSVKSISRSPPRDRPSRTPDSRKSPESRRSGTKSLEGRAIMGSKSSKSMSGMIEGPRRPGLLDLPMPHMKFVERPTETSKDQLSTARCHRRGGAGSASGADDSSSASGIAGQHGTGVDTPTRNGHLGKRHKPASASVSQHQHTEHSPSTSNVKAKRACNDAVVGSLVNAKSTPAQMLPELLKTFAQHLTNKLSAMNHNKTNENSHHHAGTAMPSTSSHHDENDNRPFSSSTANAGHSSSNNDRLKSFHAPNRSNSYGPASTADHYHHQQQQQQQHHPSQQQQQHHQLQQQHSAPFDEPSQQRASCSSTPASANNHRDMDMSSTPSSHHSQQQLSYDNNNADVWQLQPQQQQHQQQQQQHPSSQPQQQYQQQYNDQVPTKSSSQLLSPPQPPRQLKVDPLMERPIPSLSGHEFERFFDESMIKHTFGWSSDTLEAHAHDLSTQAVNLSLTVGSKAADLKCARSLVRTAEIRCTLLDQRVQFVREQYVALGSSHDRHSTAGGQKHPANSHNHHVNTTSVRVPIPTAAISNHGHHHQQQQQQQQHHQQQQHQQQQPQHSAAGT